MFKHVRVFLLQHPLLHPIHEIRHRDDRVVHHQVVMVQPLREEGSLRDYLHKEPDPVMDWAVKYGRDDGRRMEKNC